MTAPREVVIVGGGHNGLVAACLLARAGLKPLVLERRGVVGGGCVTEEAGEGFRIPTLSHAAGPMLPWLAQELALQKHGLEALRPPMRLFAPSPSGGPGVRIHEDPAGTVSDLKAISAKDAGRYAEFHRTFMKLGAFLRPTLSMTPPSLEAPGASEIWSLLKIGRAFRALGRKDAYRLLRWGPMAVADLAAEWFESDLLRAAVAARGIHGSFAGPWSAGTSVPLLMQAALDGWAIAPAATFRGGVGSLTRALAEAARAAGAEIRTGAPVVRVTTAGMKVAGVALESGEEIPARTVVSCADPRTTFLELFDPADLEPGFLLKMRNYRAPGVVAKVNYALSGLPAFHGAAGAPELLSGRIHVGPGVDALERAFDASKYGTFSPNPCLDIAIPTVADPSLAPRGAHVMSVVAQYAPYRLRQGDWDSRRSELAAAVERTIEQHAPGFSSLVVQRQVITPAELESEFGYAGGHIHHGEQSLDQLFTMRPILGFARYRGPLEGLYLCGAGTHPGGGITGGPGANAAREILKDRRRPASR
ncbi:MAG TPA: NAD(P)/FAD-dependent oxidoreductase [Candidatus Polarisedimenticolia bacterium]|nr:NAD(P)/FAD-dependent oxidoreductase [Candidatus Polarisedimenticolia bacterium]